VLVLAYHFPPLGGAGVQRLTQLARRLPELGWELTIVTGPGDPEFRWRPRDETVGLNDRTLLIRRLAGPEPRHDSRWEGRLERWLRISQRWERWWTRGVLHMLPALGNEFDVVHASVAPYSTGRAAADVAQRLQRPLVLDFEDPWALDEMLVFPSRVHRRLERRRMGSLLRRAQMVVMNTAEAQRRVSTTFSELSAERVVAIPNAFDARDFSVHPPRRADGRFHIVHTGSLHTELGTRHRAAGRLRRALGGAERGIDFLTRSHIFLLDAIASLRARDPSIADAIDVHLAGVFTAEDRAAAAGHVSVYLHEFLPHDRTIAMLRSADLLFLPMHDLPKGVRAGIVPHKTYEYLGAARPILAAVPAGDARDVLAASGVARLCAPADIAGMADAIRAEVQRWRAGEPPPAPRPEILARFEASRLAAEFSDLYTRVAREANENP
jgi:glycosyltransferase involved in cell wall biosynthesis